MFNRFRDMITSTLPAHAQPLAVEGLKVWGRIYSLARRSVEAQELHALAVTRASFASDNANRDGDMELRRAAEKVSANYRNRSNSLAPYNSRAAMNGETPAAPVEPQPYSDKAEKPAAPLDDFNNPNSPNYRPPRH